MIYLKGHLARPLDAVLSAPSRLAVLRELARARAPLSGRALARLAGINHQGAATALAAPAPSAAGPAASSSISARRITMPPRVSSSPAGVRRRRARGAETCSRAWRD